MMRRGFWLLGVPLACACGAASEGSFDAGAATGDGGVPPWTPLPAEGAPPGGPYGVWTGSEFAVLLPDEYYTGLFVGGLYDPVANSWRPIAVEGAPGAWRLDAQVAWTGSRIVVWGGSGGKKNCDFYDGATYDPAAETWTPMSSEGAPWVGLPPCGLSEVDEAQHYGFGAWTGSEFLVLGVRQCGGSGEWWPCAQIGALYDLDADAWTATAELALAPGDAVGRSGYWDGTDAVLFGFTEKSGRILRYNPASSAWSDEETPFTWEQIGVGSGFWGIWTGSLFIIWNVPNPAMYDPVANVLVAFAEYGMPTPAPAWVDAVWTGSELIVWSGAEPGVAPGARYSIDDATWTPLPAGGSPSPRDWPAVGWTGSEVIVYGGLPKEPPHEPLLDGARFRP